MVSMSKEAELVFRRDEHLLARRRRPMRKLVQIMSTRMFRATAMLLLTLFGAVQAQDRNLDQFNYDATVVDDVHSDFGPEEWGEIQCTDIETCQGWPDKWEVGRGWDLGDNFCVWCPDDVCEKHHESPINLQRARALPESEEFNICIDVHWMQYHDSTCTFDGLRATNSFRIDRHALRIIQPMRISEETGDFELDCRIEGEGRRFGRIDFSKGFSHWWYLSHADLHVPSEHTQEGKRYDAEIQLYHFYSKTGEEAGVDNEMGTVAIFMNAYDDAQDYATLNRLICAWREDEENTRNECGLPSTLTDYPGCIRYTRGQDGTTDSATTQQNALRRTRGENATVVGRARAVSAHDLILKNHIHRDNPEHTPLKIRLDPEQHEKIPDFDWDAFLAEEYAKDDPYHYHGRELLNYDHVGPWFNYFPMIGVRTEYYYRYSGTQTIPPCYGNWFDNNNRKGTNHWRMMKDPIRISRRQLTELHRLLRERIAPVDDPLAACQPDTAAKVVNADTGEISVARPLQGNHKFHYAVFCECLNWPSKFVEDQIWCEEEDIYARFYDRPYNFMTQGF